MKHVPIMAEQLPLAYVHVFEDCELLEWGAAPYSSGLDRSDAIVTYSHPIVDGALMDRLHHAELSANARNSRLDWDSAVPSNTQTKELGHYSTSGERH